MKNKSLISFLIIFIIISFCLGGYIFYDKYISKDDTKVDVKTKVQEVKEANENAMSSFDADTIIQAHGFSGSSNYLYYLKNNELYSYSKSDDNSLKLADKIKRIYQTDDGIIAIAEEDYTEYEVTAVSYLTEYELTYSDSKATILASKMLTPQGFAGSSSHHLYIRNNNLYYSNTNESAYNEKLMAENIDDIESNGETITVKTNGSTKIYVEESYINYSK